MSNKGGVALKARDIVALISARNIAKFKQTPNRRPCAASRALTVLESTPPSALGRYGDVSLGLAAQAIIFSALRASSLLHSETDSKIRQAPGLSSCTAFGVNSSECRPSRRYFWRVISDRLKRLREHNRLYLGWSCFTLRI